MIFQHFHTEQFKIYDVESSQITKMQLINTEGLRHGALSTFLTQVEIDILICGMEEHKLHFLMLKSVYMVR